MEIISRKEAKEKGLTRHFTGKPCKHGHIAERLTKTTACVKCRKISLKKYFEKNKSNILEKQRIHRENNKERERLRIKQYEEKNRDDLLLKKRKRYRENKDSILLDMANYYKKNKELIRSRQKDYYNKNKEAHKLYMQKWTKTKNGKSKTLMYSHLKRIIKNKEDRTESILGYTKYQLIQRIEFQFKDGMTWDNHGRHGWHLDHKKPISRFLEQGITDPKIINALSNLQPLWASENLSKGAKF